MARRSRNRYREMESMMTKIILADVLVFILYLVCAGLSWNVLKVITAIIAIFGSLLCVGWLYLTGEITRRRSLWMVTVFPPAVLPLDWRKECSWLKAYRIRMPCLLRKIMNYIIRPALMMRSDQIANEHFKL